MATVSMMWLIYSLTDGDVLPIIGGDLTEATFNKGFVEYRRSVVQARQSGVPYQGLIYSNQTVPTVG